MNKKAIVFTLEEPDVRRLRNTVLEDSVIVVKSSDLDLCLLASNPAST